MKVFICLLATVAACNAGFLGGQGGGASVNSVQVQPQQLQHVEPVQHVQSAPQPEVKIIKIQNLGGGYANGGGYSYGNAGGYSGASHGQAQIIKVIHEQAQGRYAPSHSAPNYKTSIESILPQILQLINDDGNDYRNQLTNVYGNSGRAIIMKGGNSADYLRGGRVVEKGHLQIMKVNRQNGQNQQAGGGGGGLGGLGGALGGLHNLFRGKW